SLRRYDGEPGAQQAARRVRLAAVADLLGVADDDARADQRAAHARAAADATAVEQHAVLDLRAALADHALPEHGCDDAPAADDGTVGDERVDRLPGSPHLVGDDLGGRQTAGRAAQRPGGIVEVEGGTRRAEVHLRPVICFQGHRLVPVAAE